MRKYLSRLIYRHPGKFHNPLMHPFLLCTAVMGVAFTFFSHTEAVHASVLYLLTLASLPDVVLPIWGVAALVVTVANLIAVMVRKRWLGEIVTWAGFLLWVYACVLYIVSNYLFQLFTFGIPNLLFWVWYWFTVRDYHNFEDIGSG